MRVGRARELSREELYPATGAGTGVAVANDGKTFAAAGADSVVKVFPLGEEKGAIELKGTTGAVVGVGHLSAGNVWVTAGRGQEPPVL